MARKLPTPVHCRMVGQQAGRVDPKNPAHAYAYSLHDGLSLLLSAALMGNPDAINSAITMLETQIGLLRGHYPSA